VIGVVRRVAPLATRLLVAAGALSLCGCFSYIPVSVDLAPVGADYRVQLTRLRMEQLRDQDPGGLPESGLQIRGTLVERDAGAIALLIPVAARQVGIHQAEIDRRVQIAVADVVEVERRRLDRGRTALAVAGLLGGVGFVIFSTLEGARFWEGSPDSPPPDAFRAPPAAPRAP
jgi:hypothetical protein